MFCYSQNRSYDDCVRYKDSINNKLHFDNKPFLSKKYSTIKIKDTSEYYYYQGIVRQFDKNNYLILVSKKANEIVNNFRSCTLILPDWLITELYTQKGSLIKRTSVFYNKINSGEAYIFNKQKKAVPSEGIGDVLYKMKTEDFVKILEQNNITPKTTKMRTGSGGSVFIEKHITPSGCFWEYQLMFTYAPFISILVSDEEKKVVAKSFTTNPSDGNEDKTFEYSKLRDSILYPQKDGFIFFENQIIDLLKKNNVLETAVIIKKYIGRTWLVQTNIDPNGVLKYQPVLLLIDDKSGDILIDINRYPKDIYGEQKFINDFNTILKNRNQIH